MSTKLTVIVDNIPHGGMRSEWGCPFLQNIRIKKDKIFSCSYIEETLNEQRVV